MLKVAHLHTDLIGKLCKLTPMGVVLEKQYEELLGIGNPYNAELLYHYHQEGKYQLLLIFVDEQPWVFHGHIFFCVKDIGNGAMEDYHWFTLDQLIICE